MNQIEQIFITDRKGRLDGLVGGKVHEDRKGGFAIKARSTIKFIFQILIGIWIYCIVLGSLMILKREFLAYESILMIFILLCAIGVGISITLYLFYPHIAPRVFDFNSGFFYTKPLSFYIHISGLDATHANATEMKDIQGIQILRMEVPIRKKINTVDQTNLVLKNGDRIPLTLQRNTTPSQVKEDAQKLATRLIVPVWDVHIITL